MAGTWTIEHVRIPEIVVPGKRLGRHVRRDSRSLAYPFRAPAGITIASQLWPRHIPVLDQGNIGSCTGNAEVGALGTGALWTALPSGEQNSGYLNEALALKIYSAAETIDGDGPYPPNDNGSSGPSAAQAAKTMGLISGYTHITSLNDILAALQTGPVMVGSNWYDSMDSPSSSGLVSIAKGATVRGGHEYLCRGVDVDKQLLLLDNSWGSSFGAAGSFSYSYATLERLLAEDGDGTVCLPVSAPAPVPVPVPTPTPVPVADADLVLYRETLAWTNERHVGQNHQVARDLKAWAKAKGF